MAPKKMQKISLYDFQNGGNDSGIGGGSWADEVSNLPTDVNYERTPRINRSDASSYPRAEHRPLVPLPDHPPFTARFLNLDYGTTEEALAGLFDKDFRILEVKVPIDIDTNRSRGFAFVEFEDRDSLERATNMDGQMFLGRTLRVLVAEQRRERGGFQRREIPDDGNNRDFNNWERHGPLPPLDNHRPGYMSRDRDASLRNYDGGFRSSGSREDNRDYEGGFRSAPRAPPPEDNRDYDHWEHRGPLPAAEDNRNRFGNRGPRRSFHENRPHVHEMTEEEKQLESVSDWRSTGPKSNSSFDRAPTKPAGRRKLNLAPRSKPLNESTQTNRSSSLFGAAKPVDTAKKFLEMEEKQAKIHQAYLERERKKAEAREAREAKLKAESAEKVEAPGNAFAALSIEEDTTQKKDTHAPAEQVLPTATALEGSTQK